MTPSHPFRTVGLRSGPGGITICPMRLRVLHITFGVLTAAVALAPGAAAESPRSAIARAYLDALVSHDASAVPFAPGATRVEAGIQTGYSGPQLAHDLENGPQYRINDRIRDLEITESGDLVTTHYLLDTGWSGIPLTTVEIHETFRIPDGTIHEIVATITPR